MTEGEWHIPPIWVPLVILFIKDNDGCQLKLLVSLLLIGGSIDNVQREIDSLKGELQNIIKILNKINK